MLPKSNWKGLWTCCAVGLLILSQPAFARDGASAPQHPDFIPDYDTILAEIPQNPRRETTNSTDQSDGIDLSTGAQMPPNDNLAAFVSFHKAKR